MTAAVSLTAVPRFNNRVFLLIMRGLWWLVALIAVILVLILIPISYELYTQMPITAGSEPVTQEVRTLFVEGLAQLGISPQVYAAFKLAIALIITAASFGMGYLLFRRSR